MNTLSPSPKSGIDVGFPFIFTIFCGGRNLGLKFQPRFSDLVISTVFVEKLLDLVDQIKPFAQGHRLSLIHRLTLPPIHRREGLWRALRKWYRSVTPSLKLLRLRWLLRPGINDSHQLLWGDVACRTQIWHQLSVFLCIFPGFFSYKLVVCFKLLIGLDVTHIVIFGTLFINF